MQSIEEPDAKGEMAQEGDERKEGVEKQVKEPLRLRLILLRPVQNVFHRVEELRGAKGLDNPGPLVEAVAAGAD